MTSYPGAHSLLTANHRLESWVYADATARSAATGFTVDDVGRVAYQQSDNSYWRLTDDSPITWATVTGGASTADLAAHIATDATQTVKGHTSWEMIQDMLNSALIGGSGITLVYDDVANTFTFHGIALLEDLTTSLVDGSIPVAETGGLVNNPDLAYDAANNRVNIGPAVGGGTLSVKHVVAADGGNAALDLENAYTNPTQPTSQYGQWTQVTGANDTNVAAHLHAAGGTKNYALITDGGVIGFGVANPVQKLEVGGNIKLVAGDVQLDSGRTVDGVDVSTLPGLIAAITAASLHIPRTMGWFFESSFTIGNQQGPTYTLDTDVTFIGFDAYAVTGPTGSAADFDVKLSTNGGSSWATIFSTRPTIAAAAHVASGAVLSTTTGATGNLIRLDIIAVGSTTPASAVTAQLKMTTR